MLIGLCLFTLTPKGQNKSELSYSRANKKIRMHEVAFRDSTIINILRPVVEEIRDTCRLQSKQHYIRLCLEEGEPMKMVLYPENIMCDFTIDSWSRNKGITVGFICIGDMMLVVQGKNAKHYVKRKRRCMELEIVNYPPSNAIDWSYWRVTMGNGAVKLERHLTKTPYKL